MADRWHSFFLQIALDCAHMSKDPNTQVGAVIVGNDHEIRSTGFNGFPRGIADTPERLNDRESKLAIIVHAELNAILNAARIGISTKESTLYLAATDSSGLVWGGPPCTRCTVEIIQAGITRVISYPFKNVSSRWKEDIERARLLLAEAGVKYVEISDHHPNAKAKGE